MTASALAGRGRRTSQSSLYARNMSRNKTTIRAYLDAYNTGAADAVDHLVAPGYVHHNKDAALSLAQFKSGAAWIRKELPDFKIEIQDLLEDADRIAVRWLGTGSRSGSPAGEAEPSKRIIVHGCTVFRTENDVIVEDWEYMDEGLLLSQIGALSGD